MNDFGKLYTRIPKRVFARQWTPYSDLPFVTNIFMDIAEPQLNSPLKAEDLLTQNVDSYFQSANKTVKVCINATVTLASGDIKTVLPLDWVCYSEISNTPVNVVTDVWFKESYTDRFELCPACLSKSHIIRGGGTIPTFEDIVRCLETGKEVRLSDGTVVKSFEDLKVFAELQGVKIG
jgi:hypothetical protein